MGGLQVCSCCGEKRVGCFGAKQRSRNGSETLGTGAPTNKVGRTRPSSSTSVRTTWRRPTDPGARSVGRGELDSGSSARERVIGP